MTEVETRLPCPVCLGVTMEITPVQGAQFMLDHCTRCGGAWFDNTEVQQLRQCDPQDFMKQLAVVDVVHQMACHSCSALLDRDSRQCKACGWNNVLDCPKCQRRMARREEDGLALDVCMNCRGVWFDRHELRQIWSLQFSQAMRRRAGGMSTAGMVALDVATDPFFLWYGAPAVGHAAGAMIEAAPGVLSGLGDLAGSVFEVIVDIISGIFD